MKLRFLQKRHGIGQVFSFDFEPEQPFDWQAGQSIRLEIELRYTSDERRFTISSAPYQKKLTITTKLSDSKFKQALNKLKPGDEIMAYGPDGVFVWSEPEEPSAHHIFIAAGIGITPFYSMLCQRSFLNLPLNTHLFYAGREGAMPFARDLQKLQAEHPEFMLTILEEQRINPKLIADTYDAINKIYVSGPTKMVKDISSQLQEYNSALIIVRDSFTGA